MIQSIFVKIFFVADNHVDKHCGDICDDVILWPHFFDVYNSIF